MTLGADRQYLDNVARIGIRASREFQHHAPERIDVSGAVYFSPLEIALNVLAFQVVTVLVLGLDPLAAAIAGYVASADGVSYIVVSIINDPHSEAARAAHDALLEWVYQGPSQPMQEVAEQPRAKPRKNPHKRSEH